MAILVPIQYKGTMYPNGIESEIMEESAPLWMPRWKRFSPKYSLHTDPSTKSKEAFPFLDQFQTIKGAYVEGIPQLWFDRKWAEEFARFIISVVDRNCPPLVIEIHPPYKDYCDSIEQFLGRYRVFEECIFPFYPGTEILIENRYGTRYKRSTFLISSYGDVVDLISQLERTGLGLAVVIDFPQLFNQMGMATMTKEHLETQLKEMFSSLKPCRERIRGIHLWGHRTVVAGHFKGVHSEDLDGLFRGHEPMKEVFLRELFDLFNDGIARYLVPEVGFNTKTENKKKVESIVNDLLSVGFVFKNF